MTRSPSVDLESGLLVGVVRAWALALGGVMMTGLTTVTTCGNSEALVGGVGSVLFSQLRVRLLWLALGSLERRSGAVSSGHFLRAAL
jgi:hypothetical protein